MLLDNEMEYTPVGIESQKAQFIETNQYLITELARWFGVPPHKLYDLSRATWANVEQLTIEVVADSIRPWAKRLQDEADHKLLGENRRGLYSQIEVRDLLLSDMNTHMLYYSGLRNVGALNSNEIRNAEGLQDIGPDGEKFTLQSGMTTLDRIGENTSSGQGGTARAVTELS